MVSTLHCRREHSRCTLPFVVSINHVVVVVFVVVECCECFLLFVFECLCVYCLFVSLLACFFLSVLNAGERNTMY